MAHHRDETENTQKFEVLHDDFWPDRAWILSAKSNVSTARVRAASHQLVGVRKDSPCATNSCKEARKDLQLMTVNVSVRSISALLSLSVSPLGLATVTDRGK